MKRLMVSVFAGWCAFLGGYAVLSAEQVPDARSSEGPALAALDGKVVLAWAGKSGIQAHEVWYSTYANGRFTPQTDIPGARTISAPALATADQRLYLATTPPDADDKIDYYVSDGAYFDDNPKPLCDAQACAHTRAAPALLGDKSTLYAAWTTPAGDIMYATHVNGVWTLAAEPIPNAKTSPTTGPTLALYQNRLHVAWVEPSGDAISIIAATLPLSSSSWSAQPVQIPGQTKVAPALGVLTVDSATPSAAAETVNLLFLAWTTDDLTIDFARWDASSGQWEPSEPPVALPSAPLTRFTPALLVDTALSPNQECISTDNVGWTEGNGVQNLSQITKPCPGVKKGPPGP
jgi:hypothetical protein